MTRQAVVVRRKMDMPTAVVAMLGMESLNLPSAFTLGPSETGGKADERQTTTCCLCTGKFSGAQTTGPFFSVSQ